MSFWWNFRGSVWPLGAMVLGLQKVWLVCCNFVDLVWCLGALVFVLHYVCSSFRRAAFCTSWRRLWDIALAVLMSSDATVFLRRRHVPLPLSVEGFFISCVDASSHVLCVLSGRRGFSLFLVWGAVVYLVLTQRLYLLSFDVVAYSQLLWFGCLPVCLYGRLCILCIWYVWVIILYSLYSFDWLCVDGWWCSMERVFIACELLYAGVFTMAWCVIGRLFVKE